MEPRKRRRGDRAAALDVWLSLRKVQRLTGCTNKTLYVFLEVLEPFLVIGCTTKEIKQAEQDLNARSGAKIIKLNGCVNCSHIFEPEHEDNECPHCGHPRYDDVGQPNEVGFYFPLRDQIAGLLSIPSYKDLLLHEWRRSKSRSLMSDVYDSPRWRAKMGPPTRTVQRIGIQGCVDSMPAHNRKNAGSVKPVQYVVLSLPPWLRYKSKNMVTQMLVVSHLKGDAAKKYYDWAATYEMNDLHTTGVHGVRVIFYGMTLDTPGRREILAMQKESAFYPCPHCLHTCQPGMRKQLFNGFRQFLAKTSLWRKREFVFRGLKYMFRDEETRDTPAERTAQLVAVMLDLIRPNRPFYGHKGLPFLIKWLGADWEAQMCDWMHDIKCFLEMLLKGLVGYHRGGMYGGWGIKDHQHRYFH